MAHPDLDALINALLPFAQEMLSKNRAFLPFGASMTRDGQIAMAAVDAGGEDSGSNEIISILIEGFRG